MARFCRFLVILSVLALLLSLMTSYQIVFFSSSKLPSFYFPVAAGCFFSIHPKSENNLGQVCTAHHVNKLALKITCAYLDNAVKQPGPSGLLQSVCDLVCR
ncbi:hypothetical protein F5Y08DRAFT_207274 [Xylaria arbuscula]|nr:hypothetical protein F5Y08DRAFT_207274 [Xylaria arbuscula]